MSQLTPEDLAIIEESQRTYVLRQLRRARGLDENNSLLDGELLALPRGTQFAMVMELHYGQEVATFGGNMVEEIFGIKVWEEQ